MFSNRVVKAMGISRMALYLKNNEDDVYHLIETKIPEGHEEGLKIPLKMMASDEQLSHVLEYEVTEIPEGHTFLDFKFTIAVRFNNKNRTIGISFLGEKESDLEYDREDMDLLKTFSNQFAIAMDNALAYKQIKEMNVSLEEKIKERTQELEDALTNLKHTQAQLIHVEKLAGLSEMVAGIVHEINNPLSFIKANLALLLHRHKKSSEDTINKNEFISSLDSSLIGVSRIEKIITELKNFSKLNEADTKEFDLHQGIDAMEYTFLNQFKNSITLEKDYKSTKKTYGNPREINVAVLELLKNAVDAILRKKSAGKIHISTYDKENSVILEIQDNGNGIPVEIRDKIFNPFFSTKDVGEGTGMGLAEAFGIVEQHRGRIEFETEVNQGSLFRMILPSYGQETSL